MDEFDFKEVKPKSPRKIGAAFWNCGSLFFFLSAFAAIGFMLLIFLNPFSGLNPLPPLPATEIPSSTPATATAAATETATFTPSATSAPVTAATFQIQEGSPVLLDSSVFHPELGCNFLGVAGQAFDKDGNPVAGLQARVTGTLTDQPVDKAALTGAATQYGSGAYYEVQLASQPVASDNTLQITLQDANGAPISAAFPFSTSASCQENLVIINFSAIQ